ncbi:hypothetical protein [Bdellovibrio sp. NC01]|uniref:hypothetical protein n=1 Tax=Bdellovibrio sp. NC01 TaxID=2220073 RepID=UPI001159410E|nr:hypothetical protein [Bdellovibrio sp. NC01]QDK37262.1 hypothetical protein DOE51_06490 [Bdellovibrio sp. NC01]
MKHIVIASLILSSSNFAFGMIKTSANLSPDAGQMEFLAAAAYASSSVKFSDTGAKSDLTGYVLPVGFYYGVNQNDSFGLTLGYISTETKSAQAGFSDTTSKNKGFNDAKIGYKGNYDFMGATFFSSAGTSIPLEKSKVDEVTMERNPSEGRLVPFIEAGLVFPVQSYSLGFGGSYNMALEGNRDYVINSTTTVNVTVKDGSQMSLYVFGEIESDYHPYLKVLYNRYYTEHFEYNGITGTSSSPYATISAEASLRFNMNPNFEIWPTLAYTTVMDKSDMNVSSYDQFIGGVSIRALY